jgi:hypothetical protein
MEIRTLEEDSAKDRTRDEWIAELRRWIWQEPFRPFTIELKSGKRVNAVASEAVGFGGNNAGVILPGGIPESFRILDIAKIYESQDMQAANAG